MAVSDILTVTSGFISRKDNNTTWHHVKIHYNKVDLKHSLHFFLELKLILFQGLKYSELYFDFFSAKLKYLIQIKDGQMMNVDICSTLRTGRDEG